MNQVEEQTIVKIETLRRARRRKLRLRQFLLFSGIVAVLLCVLYLSDFLLNFDLSARVSDTFRSYGGPGFPVPAPGGIIRNVYPMGQNLAVLNDTNLIVYNRRGRVITNIQQMTGNSMAITSRDRILTYEYGGRRVQIHSTGRELFTHSFEDMVLGAALGEGGEYAIVTSPRNFIAAVAAYNSRHAMMMQWFSSDQYVLGAAVAPRGDMMAIACIDSDGGVLKSDLYFLRFGMESPAAEVSLEGELVVWLSFISPDRLAVLTDRSYRVYDSVGRSQGVYPLPDALMSFESDGERMLLLCGAREARERQLILLDWQARETASAMIPGRVTDMAIAGRGIWLVIDEAAARYDLSLEHTGVLDEPHIRHVEYAAGRIYYFTNDMIFVLEG